MGTSLFALTFRIIGPRHVERHASLVDAVNKEAIGKPWGEQRSFSLLVSEKDAGELLKSIITNSKVDENDLVCVFNLWAPQSGFSKLILRIRSRTSLRIRGRPPSRRDFHRQ
jgi:hypothetical protein